MAEMNEEQDNSYGEEHEFRIALIGCVGKGKSSTGNNILGKKAFKSKLSGSSVTKKCEFHTAERFGKKLVVVDTPGLFDTTLSNDTITKEIIKYIGILTPGPHAFILVVKIGRFTPEEQDTVKHFSGIFGEEFFKYLIVLFTGKDYLEKDEVTIHEYVEEVPDELKNIIRRCGHKYIAFDNSPRDRKDDKDVQELLRMVQVIKNETGKPYFSYELFGIAELQFHRLIEEIRLEGKRKIAQIQKEMEKNEKAFIRREKQLESDTTDLEQKTRAIKAREHECARKTRELEEDKKRYHELKNMLDIEKRKYGNEAESVLVKAISVAIIALSIIFGMQYLSL